MSKASRARKAAKHAPQESPPDPVEVSESDTEAVEGTCPDCGAGPDQLCAPACPSNIP